MALIRLDPEVAHVEAHLGAPAASPSATASKASGRGGAVQGQRALRARARSPSRVTFVERKTMVGKRRAASTSSAAFLSILRASSARDAVTAQRGGVELGRRWRRRSPMLDATAARHAQAEIVPDGGEQPLAKRVDQTLGRRCVAADAHVGPHAITSAGTARAARRAPSSRRTQHLGACSTLAPARNGTEWIFSAPHAGQVNGSLADSTVVRAPHQVRDHRELRGDRRRHVHEHHVGRQRVHEDLEGAHTERRDRADAAEVHRPPCPVASCRHRRRVEALVDLAGDGHVRACRRPICVCRSGPSPAPAARPRRHVEVHRGAALLRRAVAAADVQHRRHLGEPPRRDAKMS